jgi:hypothetical protein
VSQRLEKFGFELSYRVSHRFCVGDSSSESRASYIHIYEYMKIIIR